MSIITAANNNIDLRREIKGVYEWDKEREEDKEGDEGKRERDIKRDRER